VKVKEKVNDEQDAEEERMGRLGVAEKERRRGK